MPVEPTARRIAHGSHAETCLSFGRKRCKSLFIEAMHLLPQRFVWQASLSSSQGRLRNSSTPPPSCCSVISEKACRTSSRGRLFRLCSDPMPRDRSRSDWSLLRLKFRASSTGCRRSDERHHSMRQPSFGKKAGIGCIPRQKRSPAGTQDRRCGCRRALPQSQGVEEQGKTRRTTFGRVLRR